MAIKVGVVGCGLMGGGITQVCAQSGYPVVVSEINDELLKKGLAAIDANLTRNVKKEKITQQDKDATLARIKGTTDNSDFGDCDLVIEAAVENLDLKKKPCVSETLDWAQALIALQIEDLSPAVVGDTLNVILKYQADTDLVREKLGQIIN